MRDVHFSGPEGDLYRLVHVAEAANPGWVRVDAVAAARVLRNASIDRRLGSRVSSLWTTLRAPGAIDRTVDSEGAIAWAVRELSRAAGLLALHRLERPRPVVDSLAQAEAAPLAELTGSEPTEEHTWVAFRLLDLHGEPIADVQYELTLADGSVQQGATDANGEARHEGIVRGSCVLVFPDLPELYWEQAHNAAE